MPSAFGNKEALGDQVLQQPAGNVGGDGLETGSTRATGYNQGVDNITSGMQNTNLNSGAGYNNATGLGNTGPGYSQGANAGYNTTGLQGSTATAGAGYGTRPTAADKVENTVDNVIPGGEHHTKSGATDKNTSGIGSKVENLIHKLIPGGDKGNNTTKTNTTTGAYDSAPGTYNSSTGAYNSTSGLASGDTSMSSASNLSLNSGVEGHHHQLKHTGHHGLTENVGNVDAGLAGAGGQYGGLPVGGALPIDKSNMVCVPGNVAAPVPVGKKVFTVAEDHATEKEKVERWVEHRPVERDYVTRVEATGNVTEQGVYADGARTREAIIAEREVAAHPTGQKFFNVPEDHAVEKERVERWTEHRPVEREFLTRVEATGNVYDQGVYADGARAREAVIAEQAVEAHPTGQKFFSVAEDHATEKERVERWVEHRPVERDYVTRVEATGVTTEQGAYADGAKAKERVLAESTCFPVGATTTQGVQGQTATGPHVVGVDAQAAPVM